MEIDKNLMKRFKVYESPTLFDLEQDDFYAILRDSRCIYCENKLKFMINGKWAYCRSKKHKKPFMIGIEKLNKINGK